MTDHEFQRFAAWTMVWGIQLCIQDGLTTFVLSFDNLELSHAVLGLRSFKVLHSVWIGNVTLECSGFLTRNGYAYVPIIICIYHMSLSLIGVKKAFSILDLVIERSPIERNATFLNLAAWQQHKLSININSAPKTSAIHKHNRNMSVI